MFRQLGHCPVFRQQWGTLQCSDTMGHCPVLIYTGALFSVQIQQITVQCSDTLRHCPVCRYAVALSSVQINWSTFQCSNTPGLCQVFLHTGTLSSGQICRNRWHHTEVAVSCMFTWLPPNHRNSKRYRMSFAIQLLRKICCAFTAAYVRGPGFVLDADLASEIKMIRLFHYRGDSLSLPCKRHVTANVTKIICTINTVTRHH